MGLGGAPSAYLNVAITILESLMTPRGGSASSSALARLANGLRISRAERNYLFELTGKLDPQRPGESDRPPDSVLACIDAIDGPAYILDRAWNACRWNSKASRLFIGWLSTAMASATCYHTFSAMPKRDR